jgi:hypothetical protein
VERTLTGALESQPRRVGMVQEIQTEQAAAVDDLDQAVRTAYADALQDVDDTVRGGSLLRGEVLARWHDVVGTGRPDARPGDPDRLAARPACGPW